MRCGPRRNLDTALNARLTLGLQHLHVRCYSRRMPVAIFQNFGVWEILLLLLVLLLVFGPKRLPEMGRSMGRGMREFKDSLTGKDKDDEDEQEQEQAAIVTTTTTTVESQPAPAPAPAPKAEQPTSTS